MTTGITFTFGGLEIDDHAQVIDCEQRPIQGACAAYPCAEDRMAGAIFVRLAGRSAATAAKG